MFFSSVKDELCSTDFNNSILESVSDHCENLNIAIGGMILRNFEQPVDDLLIDTSVYASTIVLQTLDETHRLVNVLKDKLTVLVIILFCLELL